jgi:UDP-N-acetylglucosamine 2-epimerase
MGTKMKKVVTITGIRPDFIRMSSIFKKLDEDPFFEHTLIHTGQHYDKMLSDVFFDDLEIRKPDYNLDIGSKSKNHIEQQSLLGPSIINLITEKKIEPDIILFLGDSNSVLASIPLKKEGFKIGHIEAGMRSYDNRMLEEINRKVCDHVSDLLFVYHENYKEKAMNEGISEDSIFVVGNTIIEPLKLVNTWPLVQDSEHIIMDIHRPENFNDRDRMNKIVEFANHCVSSTGFPVKLLSFPRTMSKISEFDIDLNKVQTVPMMGYADFIKYQKSSKFIISDSGTAQEEPALLGIPVIVPRDFTERPESVESGNSVMLKMNSDFDQILGWAMQDHSNMNTDWLGDGQTSNKIISILKERL